MTFNIVFNIDINLTHIQTVQYFDNMFLAKDVPRTIIKNKIFILPTMCSCTLLDVKLPIYPDYINM